MDNKTTFTIFDLIVSWFKKIFFKEVELDLSEDEKEIAIEKNVEVVSNNEAIFKFKIFDNVRGYYVKDLLLDFNGFVFTIPRLGDSEDTANEVAISSKDVDFGNLRNIGVSLVLIGDDGHDRIEVNDVLLAFKSMYLNTNGRLVYELTAQKLGLQAIVFGNASVENYKEIIPYIIK